MRFPVELPPVKNSGHLGLEINAFGAFEVYLDGQFLGVNGAIAQSRRPEVPGTETSFFLIPDSLAKTGTHLLALRASQSYLSAHQRGAFVTVANYFSMVRAPLITTAFMYILAGAFFMTSVYYLFLYSTSSHRRKDFTTLIFSVCCFLFFALLVIEYLKFYVAIPYPHFYTRLEFVGLLTFALAFLVPLYFILQFSFKKKLLLLTLLLLGLLLIYVWFYKHYDLTALLLSVLMWVATFIVTAWAAWQKEKGALIILAGLILSLVVHHFFVHDISLFLSFTLIVLCMLYLHAIRTKELEKEYEFSLLQSARLKVELLKKNIQPHFIKNTLTSLIDWIEESPQQGVIFIQALANEFDILNQIAEATLIPVEQEIALCKTHLTLMQFRKEIKYCWEETNIDPHDTLPPALIHTLLENGITHSLPLHDGTIRFKLDFEKGENFKKYTLCTLAKNRNGGLVKNTGTGFKYIQARLKESYDQNWEFASGAVPEGWLTSIKIYLN